MKTLLLLTIITLAPAPLPPINKPKKVDPYPFLGQWNFYWTNTRGEKVYGIINIRDNKSWEKVWGNTHYTGCWSLENQQLHFHTLTCHGFPTNRWYAVSLDSTKLKGVTTGNGQFQLLNKR